MHTIKEEPEDGWSDEEGLTRAHRFRESLSTVQPVDTVRSIENGWVENVTPSGRLYYYNSRTEEKSWKPPRKFPGGGGKESVQEKGLTRPQSAVLSREWDSVTSFSPDLDGEVKATNVGKILKTGILKTFTIEKNSEKNKRKWKKTFVVLTEFIILFTPVVGSFRKLFIKTKTPKPSRNFLTGAEVARDGCGNVYRLQLSSKDVLFRSKSATVAESWYQVLALVISKLKDSDAFDDLDRFDFGDRQRTNSFDLVDSLRRRRPPAMGAKSASLSDFGADQTDGRMSKPLSDFLGFQYPTPPGWIAMFDSETQQFCYVNCMTRKKWFRGMTEDGHPYFYEEGEDGRRAWLLPSIYLDVNPKVLDDIRKSTGSQKSLLSNV